MFARVSMDDGIEANVSTFAAEMRETAFILKNATEGSMVIMDELGRGTCTRDGLAIAVAVCETLIEKRVRLKFQYCAQLRLFNKQGRHSYGSRLISKSLPQFFLGELV